MFTLTCGFNFCFYASFVFLKLAICLGVYGNVQKIKMSPGSALIEMSNHDQASMGKYSPHFY